MLVARAFLWRQRAIAARTSFSPLLTSLRWSSSGSPPDGDDDDIAKARKATVLAKLRAEEANAKANAAAYADKVKAEAAEAANRADKVKAEAAEAANRADKAKAETATETQNTRKAALEADAAADAAAANKRKAALEAEAAADAAAANKRKAALEAEAAADAAAANKRKAALEVEAAGENKWARRAAVGTLLLTTSALFLGAAYLAYDELTHSKVFVRWRMKRVLRAGPPDDALPPLVPENRRFALREPHLVAGSPLLVLGPSGSGKSSLMAKMVRDLKAKKVPVAYFSTRTSVDEKPNSQTLSGGQALVLAAHKFCEAVGYPERPSRLSQLSQLKVLGASFTVPTGPAHVSVVYEAENQFAAAISELFAVCAELSAEESTTPFIVLDELHDLMSERLRKVGGENLFALIANKALADCLDRGKVEFVAAASGSELPTSLAELTKLRGDRVRLFFTDDPTEEAVAARFKAQGYSQTTAQRIISSCGTRLRVLKPFLTSDSSLTEAQVAAELDDINAKATAAVRSLLRRAKGAEVSKDLVAVLDKLGKDKVVVLADLPPVLLSPFPNNVLYQGKAERVMFQSLPLKKAWKELR